MPYHHIEELGDRSQERFALGLGARNVVGMVLAAFPILIVTGAWPIALRLPLVLLAIGAGLVLTIDAGGMAVYAWPLWWARGRLRLLAQGRRIAPDSLPGAARPSVPTPLRVGGPIRPARRRSTVFAQAPIPSGVPTPTDTLDEEIDAGLSAQQLSA